MNRQIKRDSKRKALEREELTKEQAKIAREKMIDNEIEKFLSTPSMVLSTKNALRILSRK